MERVKIIAWIFGVTTIILGGTKFFFKEPIIRLSNTIGINTLNGFWFFLIFTVILFLLSQENKKKSSKKRK